MNSAPYYIPNKQVPQIFGSDNNQASYPTIGMSQRIPNISQSASCQPKVEFKLPKYIEEENYFEKVFVVPTNRKTVPIILFNDHLYDHNTGEVSKIKTLGLVDPSTGEFDGNYKIPNKMYIVKEAVYYLREMAKKYGALDVCIISVCGEMRTGKSLLTGLMIGDMEFKQFELGHEMISKTKGVWLSTQMMKSGEGRPVIIIDSEGMGSTDASNERDHLLLLLMVLIASEFVYNTTRVPKQSDIQSLSFVSSLAESVSVENSNCCPVFTWVLRDSLLKKPNRMTITQYMENDILKAEGNVGSDNIRAAVLKYFPQRRYEEIPPPTTNPDLLEKVAQYWHLMSPEFIQKVTETASNIVTKASVKTYYNGAGAKANLQLTMLPSVIGNFVTTLNTPGKVPSFSDPIILISDVSLARCKAECMRDYRIHFEEVKKCFPLEHEQLLKEHHDCLEYIGKKFSDGVVFKSSEEVAKEFQMLRNEFMVTKEETIEGCAEIIGGEILPYYRENISKSRDYCYNLLEEIYSKFVSQLRQDMNGKTMDDYEKELQRCIQEYNSKAKGPMKGTVLTDYIKQRSETDKQMLKQLIGYNEQVLKEKVRAAEIEKEKESIKQQMQTLQTAKETEQKHMQQMITNLENHQKEMIAAADKDRQLMKDMQDKMLSEQKQQFESQLKFITQAQDSSRQQNEQMIMALQSQSQAMSQQMASLSSSISNMDRGGCIIL